MLDWKGPRLARDAAILAAAALIPLLVFAGFSAISAVTAQHSELRAQAMAYVRILSASIDRELASEIDGAEALAASPALDRLDLTAFAEAAGRERARHPGCLMIVLQDPNGIWLFSTNGAPGREAVEPESVAELVQTHRAVIGHIRKGPSGRWGLPIRAPVIRDGRLMAIVTIVNQPSQFHRLLQGPQAPDGWLAAVVNQDGKIIARTRREEEFAGGAASAEALKARARGGSGFYYDLTLDSVPTLSTYELSPRTGWSIHLGIPLAIFDQPLRRSILTMGAGLLASLVLTGAVIVLLVRVLETRRAQAAAIEQASRLEALGRLTGGVAHDFNNMLMVVQGNLEILHHRVGAEGAAEEPLAAIQRTLNKAAKLTRQLLIFARGGAVERVPVDLRRTILDLAGSIQQVAGPGVIIAYALGDAPLVAEQDPLQLEAALLNIAANARDAMGNHGRLEIAAGRERDEIFVALTDTGPGIAPPIRSKIFDPFFTTKPPGKGTGLGLTQVYEFARQSGGSVTAANAPEGGAVVTLRFPASEQPASGRTAEADQDG